jgi:DNA polymerase-1
MKLLIDADFVVYKCCASAEDEIDFGDDVIIVTSKFSDALNCVKRDLNRIAQNFFDSETILFFSDSTNFRKKIQPSYKGHRNRKKPCGYKRVINALREEYEVIVMPTLEADDALGIAATQETGNVICSPDKDMRQIPGTLFDMKETMSVTEEEGDRWHLIQTLAGDQTDGYAGVPGIGIKRAVTLFEEKGYTWKACLEAFAEKDLSEDIALENARLARILRCTDYDFKQQAPILWTPSPDYRVNS